MDGTGQERTTLNGNGNLNLIVVISLESEALKRWMLAWY